MKILRLTLSAILIVVAVHSFLIALIGEGFLQLGAGFAWLGDKGMALSAEVFDRCLKNK